MDVLLTCILSPRENQHDNWEELEPPYLTEAYVKEQIKHPHNLGHPEAMYLPIYYLWTLLIHISSLKVIILGEMVESLK